MKSDRDNDEYEKYSFHNKGVYSIFMKASKLEEQENQ